MTTSRDRSLGFESALREREAVPEPEMSGVELRGSSDDGPAASERVGNTNELLRRTQELLAASARQKEFEMMYNIPPPETLMSRLKGYLTEKFNINISRLGPKFVQIEGDPGLIIPIDKIDPEARNRVIAASAHAIAVMLRNGGRP